MNKRSFIIVILVVAFSLTYLTGCENDTKVNGNKEETSSSQIPDDGKNTDITSKNEKTLNSPNTILVDESQPEVKVIYDFADCVNRAAYTEALDKLEISLRGAYSMNDNAPLKNIKHMEIKALKDMTNEWHFSSYIKDFYAYKIFYEEVLYRINYTSPSYFKDNSIYYHKTTVVKVTKDSPWQIAETAGAPGYNH